MIGSPAWRGATASTVAAGRACFAETPVESAATEAHITIARGTQRRIAVVDRAAVSRSAIAEPRFKMPFRACVDHASNRGFLGPNHHQVKRFSHIRPPAE